MHIHLPIKHLLCSFLIALLASSCTHMQQAADAVGRGAGHVANGAVALWDSVSDGYSKSRESSSVTVREREIVTSEVRYSGDAITHDSPDSYATADAEYY